MSNEQISENDGPTREMNKKLQRCRYHYMLVYYRYQVPVDKSDNPGVGIRLRALPSLLRKQGGCVAVGKIVSFSTHDTRYRHTLHMHMHLIKIE